MTASTRIVEAASAHHERVDRKGYHLGWHGERLSAMARAFAVADMFEALTADRPYRAGLPADDVVVMLPRQAGTALCPEGMEALASAV